MTSLFELLQMQCAEKDETIKSLRSQCESLQNKCIVLTQTNIELKQKYLSAMDMTTSSKISAIQSANKALKNEILDLAQTANLLSKEQVMITNALDSVTDLDNDDENKENVIVLNEEIEVEDIESTDDEINENEIEIKQLERNEWLKNLQIDFEKYRIQQNHPSQQTESLILFHRFEDQIFKDWCWIRKQCHKNMFELLCKNGPDNNMNMEIIAYCILFDLMIASYDYMNKQYEKQKFDKSSNIIDVVLLNMNALTEIDREMYQFLGRYFEDMVDGITKAVFERYDSCLNDDIINNELKLYCVKCCEIIWDIIHYEYELFPLEMYFDCGDDKYDANIHEKESNNANNDIQFCIFPSLVKNGVHKSKIIVICNK